MISSAGHPPDNLSQSPSVELPEAPEPTGVTERQAPGKAALEAKVIEDVFPATMLASSASKSLQSAVSPQGYQAYLQNLTRAAGDPKDPLEVMMLQQLATAHQRIADLHAQSACAANTELALAYSQAAGKLMNEFRRTTLALRDYRSPVPPKQVTVVTGNEQVALVNNEAGCRPAAKKTGDTELGTNQPRLNHVDLTAPFPTADYRTPEPIEAQRTDSGRPAEAQRVGDCKPAVEAFDRPTNGCRKGPLRR